MLKEYPQEFCAGVYKSFCYEMSRGKMRKGREQLCEEVSVAVAKVRRAYEVLFQTQDEMPYE